MRTYQKSAILLTLTLIYIIGFFFLSQTTIPTKSVGNMWQNVIAAQGAEKAYQIFKQQNRDNIFGDQHLQAHLMGEALFKAVGEQGLVYCDRSFAFGCYHGFFSRAISENGVQIVEELNKACDQQSAKDPNPCKHGIGHGLVEYFGKNRLAEALAGCDLTTRTDLVAGCPSGVFMEYNFPIVINGEKAWTELRAFNQTNPYAPCEEVPENYQASCYHELAQFWGIVLEKDFQKMSDLCLNISDEEMVNYCLMGMGHMVGLYSDYDVPKAQQNCFSLDSQQAKEACFIYGSWGFTFSDEDFEKARDFCKGFIKNTQKCVQEDDITRRRNLL